MQRSAPARRPR